MESGNLMKTRSYIDLARSSDSSLSNSIGNSTQSFNLANSAHQLHVSKSNQFISIRHVKAKRTGTT